MELIAIGVFVLAYAFIAAERLPKTLIALAGGLLMIFIGILDQDQAFEAIDLNVIFLLAGMMIIADITARSGVFQWTAIRTAQIARGNPVRIVILLSLVTALASSMLDNVTTVVLMVPVTLSITRTLDVDPRPYLIAEVMASNIGGTATLIGDPPNILIGSAANLSFVAFLANLGPVVLIITAVSTLAAWLYFRPRLKAMADARGQVMALNAREAVKDTHLLRASLIVLAGTLIGFFVHQALGLEPATIALGGAVALLLWTRIPLQEAFLAIEWNTIFFFIGLFILVEGLIVTGVITDLARIATEQTAGNTTLAALLLLGISGVASAIIDNIPYTATMIPIVRTLSDELPGAGSTLWWALALGACLGGNATPIGASANVLAVNIAEREGHPISFMQFLAYGIPVTLASSIIAGIYLWLRYLL